MTNSEYWQERMLALEAAIYADNSEYIKNAEKQYKKAIRDTERDIRVWYSRFATSEGITYADAKKRLKTDELADFKLTLEEYIEKGKENVVTGEWTRVLESASARYHVSRLEALQLQMRQHVEVLMTGERKGIYSAVKNAYEKSYYKSIFEVQSGFGVGATFSDAQGASSNCRRNTTVFRPIAKLDTASVEKVLSKPWTVDGTNFSERIWGKYRPQLVQELNNTLSQAIIRGQNPNDFASDIAKKFNVKQHQAENLLRTEAAYFQTLAEYESMKELGVAEYEIVATLDSRTTEICRSMDGKHFKVSDLKPGVTAPPFHCRCRSCTAPYFDDEFEKDTERIARDEDGESYYVPSDMKYDEWYETFVEGNGDSGKYSTDSENARHWTRSETSSANSSANSSAKNSTDGLTTSGKSDIIKESAKSAITKITDKAIENVKYVKIDGLTSEQSDFVQQQHKELLKFARDENDGNEAAFVFNSSMEKVGEYKGTDDSLEFGWLRGKDLLVMHNHPRNSSYSDRDIIFLISSDEVKTLTIVKNNGNIETLTKINGFDKKEAKTMLSRIYKKYVKNETDAEISKAINIFLKKYTEGLRWER